MSSFFRRVEQVFFSFMGMPLNSLNKRPDLSAFASQDGTGVKLDRFSPTFSRIKYSGAKSVSFGGAFFTYDNPATANVKESINFDTAFVV